MRIVLLSGYYYPDTTGGTESYVQSLGANLQEEGHEVFVAAPSTGPENHHYEHEGLQVVRYPVEQNPSRDEVQGRATPPFLNEWSDSIDRLNPDLVHMHSLTRGCSLAHARAVTRRSIPMFVTLHVPEVTCPRGTLMRWGSTPCDGEIRPVRCGACVLQEKGLPKALSWITSGLSLTGIGRVIPGSAGTALRRAPQIRRRRWDLKAWVGSAEHVVVVADWLREVLERNDMATDKITVSRHGLSDSMLHTQQKAAQKALQRGGDDSLQIGFVGRFTRIKGPHVLVQAVGRLPEEVDVEAHLYGLVQNERDQRYLSRLEVMAEDDPRIRFCGPMTDMNRVAAFAEFDVLAVPSVGFETGPYTVLEAFAAEIPVLGSNHGGIAERVDDSRSGVLVPPGDVSAWKREITRLWRRKRSGNWTWDIPTPRSSREVAREMLELYGTCNERPTE